MHWEFWAIFFAIMMLLSMFGWWAQSIGTQALIFYMKNKGYKLPNEDEIRQYTRYTARKELGLPTDDID